MGYRGRRGFTGPLGLKGQKGDLGDQGQPGSIGYPGPKGEQGVKGEKGNHGDDGPPGPLGPQGWPGSCLCDSFIGPPGIQGPPGAQGAQGLPGTVGSKGSKGANGDKGDMGVNGNDGAEGLKGELGDPGECDCADGKNGTDGQKGDKGETGVKGDIGPQGDQGDTGAPGPIGDPGFPGIPGPCSMPVQSSFCVGLDESFPLMNRPVRFNRIISNVYDHYNTILGIYIAPTNGTYVFDFNFAVNEKVLIVGLFVNFFPVLKMTESTNYATTSGKVVLHLLTRDLVWIQIKDNDSNGMFVDGESSSTFCGFLLSPDSCSYEGFRDHNPTPDFPDTTTWV